MKIAARSALIAAICFGATAAFANGPVGYSAWDVAGNDKLVRMDLSSGVGTVVGSDMGFSDVDGLAFNASNQLYGVDDSTNQLLRIDTTHRCRRRRGFAGQRQLQ